MENFINHLKGPHHKNLKVYENYYTTYMQKSLISDFDVHFAYVDAVPADVYGGTGVNDFYVIECCTDGHGIITMNGTDFHVREGDCYINFPYTMTTCRTPNDSSASYAWFGFSGLNTEFYLRQLGVTPRDPFLNKRAYPFIRDTIRKMSRNFIEEDLANRLFQTAQVNLIFSKLFSLHGDLARESNISEYVRKTISYIDEHFSEPISISSLATTVGLNRSYFFEIFKSKTGLSPQEYLIHYRIRQACALLINNSSMSISAVAAAVGYNAKNFMHIFKKMTGSTPSEYRSAFVQDSKKGSK